MKVIKMSGGIGANLVSIPISFGYAYVKPTVIEKTFYSGQRTSKTADLLRRGTGAFLQR